MHSLLPGQEISAPVLGAGGPRRPLLEQRWPRWQRQEGEEKEEGQGLQSEVWQGVSSHLPDCDDGDGPGDQARDDIAYVPRKQA